MKNIILFSIIFVVSGCFEPVKFDSSTEASIKESTKKINESLPLENRDQFQKALMYFSIGGEDFINARMAVAFDGKSSQAINVAIFSSNLKAIDGLTGGEILQKYMQILEKDRIKREKELEQKISDYRIKEKNDSITEKNNYQSNVEITEFVAKRIDTYGRKSAPAIRLSIKNNGNRSLDEVEIVVYFKNKESITYFPHI